MRLDRRRVSWVTLQRIAVVESYVYLGFYRSDAESIVGQGTPPVLDKFGNLLVPGFLPVTGRALRDAKGRHKDTVDSYCSALTIEQALSTTSAWENQQAARPSYSKQHNQMRAKKNPARVQSMQPCDLSSGLDIQYHCEEEHCDWSFEP